MSLELKRAYDAPSRDDGYRILIDRLWPRGLAKERAQIDLWLKGIAPSPGLRKWFGHDPAKWSDFSKRYLQELASNQALNELKQLISQHQVITLVYGARDTQHNHALVIQQALD